jgi:ribose transport system permease protein
MELPEGGHVAIGERPLERSGVGTHLGRAGTAALRLLNRYSFAFALLLTLALLAATLIRDSNFGWNDQLANFAPMALAAMASTPAIISGGGGFDLSISPLMYFCGEVFIIWLAPHSLGGAASVPIILALGAAVGLLNGLVIILLRVPPVVATLSMYFVLIGVDLRVAPNPKYLGTNWIHELAGTVGPIPGALFTLGFPILVWLLIGLIPYRRTLYAVGSNDATAFASGVNVAAVRVVAYTLGGMFAGVGALALVALTSSANPSLSTTYTLLAIAAVALGGTSLWGGRGGLIGPMLGAASIYLLGNLLITLQVDPSYLQVMYGGMLIFAVILGGLAGRARASA